MRKLAIVGSALVLAAVVFLVTGVFDWQRQRPVPVTTTPAVPEIGPGESLISFPEPMEGTPEPNPVLTVKAAIQDAVTQERVVATSVVLDGQVIAEQVSEFEVTLPGEVVEGYVDLEVFAPGYERWAVGLRFNLFHSRTYLLPIRLNPLPTTPAPEG